MELSIGAICFGLVIGWITYRTLRRKTEGAAMSDLSSVIAAVGGGAITAIWGGNTFESYSIGLAIGFFSYFIVAVIIEKGSPESWMMAKEE